MNVGVGNFQFIIPALLLSRVYVQNNCMRVCHHQSAHLWCGFMFSAAGKQSGATPKNSGMAILGAVSREHLPTMQLCMSSTQRQYAKYDTPIKNMI
jgi:hypothetical protein